jgi:hypothetical protein
VRELLAGRSKASGVLLPDGASVETWPDLGMAAPPAPDAAGEETDATLPYPSGEVGRRLVVNAASLAGPRDPYRPLPLPQAGAFLQQRYASMLPPEGVRARLDAFRRQWNGQAVRDDGTLYVFHIRRPLGFWQRCLGRQAGLAVCVHLTPPGAGPAGTTQLTLQVRPQGCGREEGVRLLKTMGPLLLDSAVAWFQVTAERRARERFPWPHPVQVRFVLAGGHLGEPVGCRGKDISPAGLGFYLPSTLPGSQVCVELAAPDAPPVTRPANVVRVQRFDNACCEVGAAFC